MPSKTKTTAAAEKATLPPIPAQMLEQLIPGPVTPAQFEDIFQRFKKAFMDRALGAEAAATFGAVYQGVGGHGRRSFAKPPSRLHR